MNLSPYFHDLISGYQAEIDDLTSDSEGKDVLQRRLKDKRSGFAAVISMMDTDPLMLVPAFHGAFSFDPERLGAVEAVLGSELGDFPPWSLVSGQVRVAAWAQPLVELALAEPMGEEFMALAVGLEYLVSRPQRGPSAEAGAEEDDRDAGGRDGDGEDRDEGEGDGDDGGSLGEDFLEQQGFDRRTPK